MQKTKKAHFFFTKEKAREGTFSFFCIYFFSDADQSIFDCHPGLPT